MTTQARFNDQIMDKYINKGVMPIVRYHFHLSFRRMAYGDKLGACTLHVVDIRCSLEGKTIHEAKPPTNTHAPFS